MLNISDPEDRRRFAVLDRLILGGWANTIQRMIPAEVLEAAEHGREIPVKGNDRDKDLARAKTVPTPDELIFQRRLADAARKRRKYNSAKERLRQQRMKYRAAGPAEMDSHEGNQECRL